PERGRRAHHMKYLARLALDHSRPVIALFAIVTVALALSASRIATDNDTGSLYPDESRVEAVAEELRATVAHHDRLLLVVEGDIYTPGGLEDVRRLTAALRQLPGVADVTSVATAKRMEDDDGLLVVDELVPVGELAPEEVAGVRRYLETSPMYENVTLVSRDGRYASVIIEVDEGLDANEFARSVVKAVEAGWPGPHYLAGQAFTSMELQSTIGRDLPVLGGLALLAILIMLFLNFRTVQGTLLPLALILLGVIWGMGLFQLL